MEGIWAVVGFLLGGGVVFLLLIQSRKALEARTLEDRERLKATEQRQAELSQQLEECQKELAEAQAQAREVRAMLDERDKAHEQRLVEVKSAREEFANQFKALSGTALAETTKQFLDQAEQVLKTYRESAEGDREAQRKEVEALLNPMKETLKSLDDQNKEMEKNRDTAYGAVLRQLQAINEQQSTLKTETSRLVKALQDPGSAGSWGEMVLERVVELAGLEGYWNYVTQETVTTDDGRQRPDMVIQLPGGRSLIIDSKAPMRSYLTALDTEDGPAKEALLADHASKLLQHARELKRRDYSKLIDTAPDFVVLFVPSESAYRVAVEKRPALFEEASDFNVVIATPMALLPLLKAIAYGWQQERLALSAKQLQADAATLYDRICKIALDYVQLGKALSAAGKKYNEMGGTLESRVLPAARKFKDHGVQSNNEIAAIEPIEFSPRPLQAAEFDQGLEALPESR